MEEDDLVHFRFNKRKNIIEHTDKFLKEVQKKNMIYCITPSMSNNPHIIRRSAYINKALPHVRIFLGSKGIEHRLNKVKGLNGSIYGPLNYEKTIYHLDGRQDTSL